MNTFEPSISNEMFNQLVLDIYEYVQSGTLSKKRVMGVTRELLDKRDDDGNLVYWDVRQEVKYTPLKFDAMYQRINRIVRDWRKYLAPLMEPYILEATFQHALKAKDNVTSFKAAAEVIMPKEKSNDGSKLALPSRVAAILQQSPVGTTIIIGEAAATKGTGDKGHAGADRVHPVADGQQENTPVEVVSHRDDKPVHGMSAGEDTAQGNLISDTTVPSEDPVDNDGGAGLETSE